MAGKTNLTFTTFSAKKLLSKANTSMAASDNEEVIGSSVQVGSETIFGDSIPSGPTKTLYTVQSASADANASVEYVELDLTPVNASYYDANTYDGDASAQAAGFHAYIFKLKSDYESSSNNTKKGNGVFDNTIHLTGTLGGLQIVPPSFSLASPNPYTCTIYSGSRDVDDQISLTDEIDWYVDYYNGILFVQDYDANKIPTRAKAFIYVGRMLSDTIGGGGSGSGVGWVGSGNGGISTTGSLFVGTNGASPSAADIYLSNNGAAVFNEQANNVDFRVESVNRQGAILVNADTDQVLILSGGSAASINESAGTDVAFYVSGSVGSRGTTTRGTAVFGGDVAVSGGLYFGEMSSPGSVPDGSIALYGKDNGSGVTKLYFKHGATETEVGIATGGTGGGVGWVGTAPSLINTTGSLGVSGSLFVSEYIKHIGDEDTYLRFQSDELDLQVGGKSMVKMSEGSNDQVLIMSGGSAKSVDPKGFADANFFVSGAIGSKNTTTSGVSVFGGDAVVSGSSYTLGDLYVGDGSNAAAIRHNGNNDLYIRYVSNDTMQFVAGGNEMITLRESTYDVLDINSQKADIDFRVYGQDANNPALMYDAGKNQILFLSGGSPNSPNLSDRADINYFVSGTIGSKNTATRGTAVFGGDLHISGNLSISGPGDGGSIAFSGGATVGGNLAVGGNIVPNSDLAYNLGSESARFANIYTGDLHLRNERGHWQIIEESDCLTVTNKLTGKRYKMVLEPYLDGNIDNE